MASFVFTVDDDPPHSGFSLGHIDVSGSDGTATTRGHTPDQRVMVYLSAAQLLWDARVLVDAGKGDRSFVGADSSFTLKLTLKKGKVETRHGKDRIDVSPVGDFLDAVFEAARNLHSVGRAEIEEDHGPLEDLGGAIAKFEAWQASR